LEPTENETEEKGENDKPTILVVFVVLVVAGGGGENAIATNGRCTQMVTDPHSASRGRNNHKENDDGKDDVANWLWIE
jgi:hypothetical protein